MPIHNLHSDWMDLALSHASCGARHWAPKVPWRRRRGLLSLHPLLGSSFFLSTCPPPPTSNSALRLSFLVWFGMD